MECTIETKAATILQFFQGLNGSLHVTLEEGTWASWLYDLLKPHVTKMVVCNPRRNALLKEGSKSDRIDARELAELPRSAPDVGAQDRRDHLGGLEEERSALRRQLFETTNSLSVSGNPFRSLEFLLVVVSRVLETLGIEGSLSW